jgi:hypothetical protein
VIKVAQPSPRVCEDGTIRWYAGDTFEIEFDLSFVDDFGEHVDILPTDEISICIFQNKGMSPIYETSVIGESKLIFAVDEELTKQFPSGEYFYNVRRNSVYITTIMKRNRMVVE